MDLMNCIVLMTASLAGAKEGSIQAEEKRRKICFCDVTSAGEGQAPCAELWEARRFCRGLSVGCFG